MFRTMLCRAIAVVSSATPLLAQVGEHASLLPAPPPLTASSRLDSMFTADRVPVTPDASGVPPGIPSPTLFEIPAAQTGTGFAEKLYHLTPDGYDPAGPLLPMLVAYHGLSVGATSPHAQSLLDEFCWTQGWIYMAPTGLDPQVFGTPLSQQNTEAAIEWMLENFQVDPDRICMVGFSMGGGVVLDFAARHRDPDGIMIAAVGAVSATCDWVMEYNRYPEVDSLGNPTNRTKETLFHHPLNFGGAPDDELFRYQQASALHHDPASYLWWDPTWIPSPPPGAASVGTLLSHESMATNLHGTPVYITYDSGDTILHIPALNDELDELLDGMGGTVKKVVTSGTMPFTHSWAVLNAPDLLAFFDGKVAQRYPTPFFAQLDLGGRVAWVDVEQATAEAFSYVDGWSDAGAGILVLQSIANATQVGVDGGLAGTPLAPRISAANADALGTELAVGGFAQSPSYLLAAPGGSYIPGVDSAPVAGKLFVDLPASGSLAFDVVHDPDWSGVLTTSPNPSAPGGPIELFVQGPTGASTAWVIVAVMEQLVSVKGFTVAAVPVPPALVFPLPLGGGGFGSAAGVLPNDPALSGLALPTQAIFAAGFSTPVAVSNLWGLHIE